MSRPVRPERVVDTRGRPVTVRREGASEGQSALPVALARRAWLDLIAGLLSVVAAATCLGAVLMYFTVLGSDLDVPHAKLARWFASALPCGALFVFALSYRRFTPWFAGIVAALVAWQLPFLTPAARVLVLLGLGVGLGLLEALARHRRSLPG